MRRSCRRYDRVASRAEQPPDPPATARSDTPAARRIAGQSSTANRNVGVTDLSARTRSSVPSRPSCEQPRARRVRGLVDGRAPGRASGATAARAAQAGCRKRPREPASSSFIVSSNKPRGRHAVEHVGKLVDRRFGVGVQREAELRREARGPQHAHRVLAIACLGVADHAQHARARIRNAADVSPRSSSPRCCSRARWP